MKPRIVILSAFLTPFRSGAEACAEEVPLALKDKYDFTIVTARLRRSLPKNDLLQGEIPVRRVGFGFGFDKWLFPFLAPFAVRKVKPDIVHAVLETFAGLALVFCKRMTSAKRMLTLQTTNRSFLKGLIVRSPNKVTAISSALKEIATKLGRDDVTVIPNGIDASAINESRLRHGKVAGRILFVGRLEPQKGVDTLLQAFAKLQTDATLRIVGDGSQRAQLEKLTKELGIADRVTFVGYIPAPQVYDEYAQAELFCGLSRSEALGNVFLEAQAAGCATIGTNVHGIPDILVHGKAGWLVQPDNIEEAVEALNAFLRDEDGIRTRFSQVNLEHVKQFDWQNIAEQYSDQYNYLLSRTS